MSTRCEETVAAMAAGGPIHRWRARRHAARCPRCAAALDELRRIAADLAEFPPLSVAERRLWAASAADATDVLPLRSRWSRPDPIFATAAVLFTALVALWASWPPGPRPDRPAVVRVDPPRVTERPRRDVDRLRGDVVALVHELDDLKRRAELLDARKEVEALLDRLALRGRSSGL